MAYFDQDEELARSRAATKKAQKGGSGKDFLSKGQAAVEQLQNDLVNELEEARKTGRITSNRRK